MTSPAPTTQQKTRSFLVPFLIVVGLALHSLAITIGASPEAPFPSPDRPVPAPSIGPQPRFDDGGRLIDVPELPYTFTIPAGWALVPFHINRDARLWPAHHPHKSAEIRFKTYDIDRDTDRMTDQELAVYARTAVRGWSPNKPHLAFQRTADGSRAYRFQLLDSPPDEHYYTLIFHGRTALVVTTGVGIEPTPEHKRDVQKANDAAIASIRFR